MPEFNFWSPSFDVSKIAGVLQGARSLERAGQFEGAGIAAKGQAIAQGMAVVGQAAAKAIQEDKLEKEVEKFIEGIADDSLYTTTPYTEESITKIPGIAAIRDKYEGMDGSPDANAASKYKEYVEFFQTTYFDDQASAVGKANDLIMKRSERIMTPEGRASQMRAFNALVKQGMDPRAMGSLIAGNAGASSGYARQSDSDAAQKMRDKYYVSMSPQAENQQAIALKEEKEAIDEAQAEAADEDIARQIEELMRIDVTLPDGRSTGFTRVADPGEVTTNDIVGTRDAIAQRMRDLNLPGVEEMEAEMDRPFARNYVGVENLDSIRQLMVEQGTKELNAQNARLIGMGVYSGQNDPNLRKMLHDRADSIQRAFLNEMPRRLEEQTQKTRARDNNFDLIEERLDAGTVKTNVPVSSLNLFNADAVMAWVEANPAGFATTTVKADLARLTLSINAKGNLEVGGGTPSTANLPAFQRLFQSGLFADPNVLREVVMVGTSGIFTKRTPSKTMEALDAFTASERGSKLFRRMYEAMAPGGSVDSPPTPAPTPTVTPSGGSDVDLDPLSRLRAGYLPGEDITGATVGSAPGGFISRPGARMTPAELHPAVPDPVIPPPTEQDEARSILDSLDNLPEREVRVPAGKVSREVLDPAFEGLGGRTREPGWVDGRPPRAQLPARKPSQLTGDNPAARFLKRMMADPPKKTRYTENSVKDEHLRTEIARLEGHFERESRQAQTANTRLQKFNKSGKLEHRTKKRLEDRLSKELDDARAALHRVMAWKKKHPVRGN